MRDSVGHYRLLDRMGTGAMGELYRARDTRAGRTAAVRLIDPAIAGDPGRRAAFLACAAAIARLSHPNIAMAYEAGEEDDVLFLACEFVPGESLTSVINGQPLNPRRALDLAAQMADALADAHAAGIVHGDLRPENVIVTPKGNAKILEFGLAEWTGGAAVRRRAALLDGALGPVALTTIAYMSPEQIVGERSDARTDVFSLGVITFEMLTGAWPFTAATPAALALQIAQATPPAPSAANPSLPPAIDDVVGRALAKSFDSRYDSAAMLAAGLRSVSATLDERTYGEAAAASSTTVPAGRTNDGGVRWIVMLLLLAAALAVGWWQRDALTAAWLRLFGG